MIEMEPNQGVKPRTKDFALQVSFLYTDQYRNRILRIINHVVGTSPNQRDVLAACDYQAVAVSKGNGF